MLKYVKNEIKQAQSLINLCVFFFLNIRNKEKYEPERFRAHYKKRLEELSRTITQNIDSTTARITNGDSGVIDNDSLRDLVYACLVYTTPGVPWATDETARAAHRLLSTVLNTPYAQGATTETGLVNAVLSELVKRVFTPGMRGCPAERADPTLLHAAVHCFTDYVKYPDLSQYGEYVVRMAQYLLENKECVGDLREIGAILLGHTAHNINAAEYRWYKDIITCEVSSTLWSHDIGVVQAIVPCAVRSCVVLSDDKKFVESVLNTWIKCISLATDNSIKRVFLKHLVGLLDACPLDVVILNMKQLVPLTAEHVLLADAATRATAAQAVLWLVNKCWVRMLPYCMVVARYCAVSFVDWAGVEGNERLADTIREVFRRMLDLCKVAGDDDRGGVAHADLEAVAVAAGVEITEK